MQKLTVLTTFSGIGMQERGLFNSKCFDIEVVGTSDIDKNAILSYAAIHCGLTMDMVKNYSYYPSKEEMVKELAEKRIGYDFEKKKETDWQKVAKKKDDTELKKYWLAVHLSKNLGDISLVKRLPYADILSFSFPCTDISVAGTQKGVSYEDWKNGASTRSGLVWEIVRLLSVSKANNELPKYLLMENVSALLSKKFVGEFNNLNRLIGDIGYNVYYQQINGRYTGVPQNRNRVFGVYIRKDIDNHTFQFPKPFDNGVRLLDVLEDEVADKYFLSQQIQDRFVLTDDTFTKDIIGTTKPVFRTIGQRDYVYKVGGVMGCLVATDYKQPKQILVSKSNQSEIWRRENINKTVAKKDLLTQYQNEKYSKNIREIANGNKLLSAILYENTINDKIGCDMSLKEPKIREIANCIEARYNRGVTINYKGIGTAVVEKCQVDEKSDRYYIRKLTPKECFRLMGMTAEDCQRCYDMGESDNSLYKQAGNGIITNCIKLIAEHLFKAQYKNDYVCEDETYVGGI